MPTKTVAYLRVSTNKQADKGISLDAQRAKALAYAGLYDLDLVEIIVDPGASAKTLDRQTSERDAAERADPAPPTRRRRSRNSCSRRARLRPLVVRRAGHRSGGRRSTRASPRALRR
jgi:hypothetical protein